MMSNLQNNNLEVANFARVCVENAKENDKYIDLKKYKILSKKMTTLIQKNGLINTLVFVLSKCNIEKPKDDKDIIKKQFNNKILWDIVRWTKENNKTKGLVDLDEIDIYNSSSLNEYCNTKQFVKYLKKITELSPVNYRLLTKEMMTLFAWVKRFSDGMIEGD